MSEMVERVAKAINKEAYENQCRVIGLHPNEARAYARAAIEAMASAGRIVPSGTLIPPDGLTYWILPAAAFSPSREDEGK